MKKCPFCAEDIQNEAIKCKHCGEWLSDGCSEKKNEIRLDVTTTTNTFPQEMITKVMRQIFTVASFGERPDNNGRVTNDLILPYADMADWVYTNERLIFVKTEWRYSPGTGDIAVPPLLLPLSLLTQGLEVFQSWRKDQRIDVETIDTLCNSGVGAYINISDTRCVVCDVKRSFSESITMSGYARILFKGKFHTQNKMIESDISTICLGKKEKIMDSLKKTIFKDKGEVVTSEQIISRDWVGCALL